MQHTNINILSLLNSIEVFLFARIEWIIIILPTIAIGTASCIKVCRYLWLLQVQLNSPTHNNRKSYISTIFLWISPHIKLARMVGWLNINMHGIHTLYILNKQCTSLDITSCEPNLFIGLWCCLKRIWFLLIRLFLSCG